MPVRRSPAATAAAVPPGPFSTGRCHRLLSTPFELDDDDDDDDCRRLPSSFSTASWSFADDDAHRDDRDDDDSLLEGDPTTTPKFAWPRA
jgi:hypothetical protein